MLKVCHVGNQGGALSKAPGNPGEVQVNIQYHFKKQACPCFEVFFFDRITGYSGLGKRRKKLDSFLISRRPKLK
jgi:hypothetical protein